MATYNSSKSFPRYAQLDDVLHAKIEAAFECETDEEVAKEIAKIAQEVTPIDLAYVASFLSLDKRVMLYKALPSFETKIGMMNYAETSTREVILEEIENNEIRKLIEAISPQKAVDLLTLLGEERKYEILSVVDPQKLARIQQIQQYDEDSAGRIMSNEFFAFSYHTTIGKVADYIRGYPNHYLEHAIFVVAADKYLKGYVSARSLLVNPPELHLQAVMEPIYHKVTPETPREKIISLFERYKLRILPVVDSENALLGVITDITVVEAWEDIVNEMMASIAGTNEEVPGDAPVLKRYWARIPWLIGTACGGLINTKVQSSFNWFEFGIFFVSLITGLSGNIGLQCSTVLVRGMATGNFSVRNQTETIFKEVLVGSLTGITFGMFCGLVIYSFSWFGILPASITINPLQLSVIIGSGLLGACLNATLLGVFSPIFFARIGVDPAVASGPIVTAFNDIISTIIYFYIAQLILYIWV